jgi:hypothetical protein
MSMSEKKIISYFGRATYPYCSCCVMWRAATTVKANFEQVKSRTSFCVVRTVEFFIYIYFTSKSEQFLVFFGNRCFYTECPPT